MLEISLAVLIGLFLIFIITQKPFVGLVLFTILLYIKPGVFSSAFAVLHLNRVIGFFTAAVLLIQAGNKSKLKFFDAVQSKWMIAFGIVMCFSMTTSIWRGNTFSFLLNFFKFYIAYFLIINLISSINQYRTIIWVMLLSMLYIGVTSIIGYRASGGEGAGGRMFGMYGGALFSDPNDMAMGFILLLPFLYYDLFRGAAVLRKVVLLGTIGIYLYGIVLTQSRGGFLGLIGMLFVFWLRSRRKMALAIILTIFLVLGWYIAPQAYKDRIGGINTAIEGDPAAISRMDAWKAGWGMMTHRLFGVGAGNFGEGFVRYRPPDAVDFPGMRRAAHNMFIEVGGEAGFAGLVVFIFMIWVTFMAFNRVKRKILKDDGLDNKYRHEIMLLVDATFLSLVGYCASGMFLSQAYNFILYYLIGFSVVLENLSKVGAAA